MKNSKTFLTDRTVCKLFALLAVIIVAAMPVLGCTKWNKPEEPNSYIVTFDSDGGSAVTAQHVLPGELATEPKDPKNGTYEFGGWYKDAKLTTPWNFDSDRVNANITLYAKWNNPQQPDVPGETFYTVTFDSNGGSAVPSKQVKSGEYVAMPAEPTRDGYEFICWCADSALTDEWIFGADTVSSHIRLYAKWKDLSEEPEDPDEPGETVYTVTFNSTGGSAVEQKQVKSGETVAIPTEPKRDGYKFVCWCTDSTLETEWKFATDIVESHTTLYAKWDSLQAPETYYNVTFDSNGGSAVAQKQIKSGGYVTEPTEPTRDGYKFICWCKDGALSNEWNFSTDTVTTHTTLYAKWEALQTPPTPSGNGPTVTFNVGYEARKEGVSNPPAQKANNGKITAPTVTRNGYNLTGWYVDNGTTKWDFASSTVTTETTLFAKWQRGSGSTGGNNSATIGGGTAVEYTPAASLCTSGKIYIHYLRTDSAYTEWTLYVWSSDNDNKTYTSTTVDESGKVFEVTPSEFGLTLSTDATLKFIVTKPGWVKDGGDNAVQISSMANISGSYHWFVQQGKTNQGSNKLTISSGGGNDDSVDRSYAKNLPVASTPTGWDEVGVGYQIFVASFCDSDGDGVGDLRGIINKLGYLESLSVDVLWLTPIQSSDSYHGYDCYDYYAIDPKFGTNADYRELVYKAHQKGMKIIMDLVVNHTSRQNEWFIKSKAGTVETVTYQDGTTKVVDYGKFYRWKDSKETDRYNSAGNGKYYYSSFNDTMPELNYDYQPARDAMTDVAMYWMAYGLDGFRMDAIKHMFMWDESEHATDDVKGDPNGGAYVFNMTKNVEWFKEFNYRLKAKYPYCFLLGENLTGDPTYVAPFYAGMDSLFDFNTYYNLPKRIKGEEGGVSSAASAFNNNANSYAAARNGVGRAINGMITSNHDVDRLAAENKLNGDVAKMKLYISVMMTMPGCHWIYYGDEIGLKSGTKSAPYYDDTYRQSMKWTSNWANKCTALHDFNYNDSLASVDEQFDDPASLLFTVRAITKVRHENPVLISGTATCSAQDGVLKITVTNGTATVVAYHNFTNSTKTISPSGVAVYGSSTLGAYGSAVYRV